MTIEFRWAESQIDRLPELAGELVRRKVAVIVAPQGTASALAAKTATTTIPIVFKVSEDPVRTGLVASLARPGSNLTGINFFSGELVQKRLELLRELVPGAARIAVLVNPANAPNTETTLREVERAALAIGLQILILKASTSREINAVFATLVSHSHRRCFVMRAAGDSLSLLMSALRLRSRASGVCPAASRTIRCDIVSSTLVKIFSGAG